MAVTALQVWLQQRQQRRPPLCRLLLSVVVLVLCHGNNRNSSSNSSSSNNNSSNNNNSNLFSAAASQEQPFLFNCDPCIDRSQIKLRVFLPSPLYDAEYSAAAAVAASSSGRYANVDWGHLAWRQIHSSLNQAAGDLQLELDIIADNSNGDDPNFFQDQLRKAKTDYFFYQQQKRTATPTSFDSKSTQVPESQRLDGLIIAIPPYQSDILSILYEDINLDSSSIPTFSNSNNGNQGAVLQTTLPVFGFHAIPSHPTLVGQPLLTYAVPSTSPSTPTASARIVSWIGHSDYQIGVLAAQTLLQHAAANDDSANNNNDAIQNVAFITYQQEITSSSPSTSALAGSVQARLDGMSSILLQQDNSDVQLDTIYLTRSTPQQLRQQKEGELSPAAVNLKVWLTASCRYDTIVIADTDSIESTLEALRIVQPECGESTIRTVIALDTGDSPLLYRALSTGEVDYALHMSSMTLPASLSVIMAAMYTTTAQKVALPRLTSYYSTGPIVLDSTHLQSTDAFMDCQLDAFPICAAGADSITLSTSSRTTSSLLWPTRQIASPCPCLFRAQEIRIGGVLHGVTTDTFWDVVFASAEQAAFDMGNIKLELERFQPPTNSDSNVVVHELMAARIRILCASGIDGLFVTIPSDVVIPAIEQCLKLKIPIISVNSGQQVAQQLSQTFSSSQQGNSGGDSNSNSNSTDSAMMNVINDSLMLNHIGMDEYNAGYGGGRRMIAAGIKTGYCLNHAFGNTAVADRCRGFGDAISDHNQEQGAEAVIFAGHFPVPSDNAAKYKADVEKFVNDDTGDWEGIGFMLAGTIQIEAMRNVLGYTDGGTAGGTAGDSPSATKKAPRHKVLVATFDVSPEVYEMIDEGFLLFGIDQQPFFQGNLAVYLLTYYAVTKQRILDFQFESGPSFVDAAPSAELSNCQEGLFEVCPYHPIEEYNLISDGILALGYVLFSIVVCLAFVGLGWTWYHRAKWVVQVSQPLFLVMIAFGTMVSASSIVFMGMQTEYRDQQDRIGELLLGQTNPEIHLVDACCMAGPWLYGMGFVITFSALLAKIQRVKMIYEAGMNMQRKRIGFIRVVPIMVGMMLAQIAILLSWQLIAPLRWQREVLDEFDGFTIASVGSCDGGRAGWYFYLGLVLFHIVCLIYALVLCFQTRQISSDLAESSYLSLAVIFMFQTLVLAVPIAALVQETTDVFYFVRAGAVFMQNMTVLTLIFIPKMLRIWDSADMQLTSAHSARSRCPSGLNITSTATNSYQNNKDSRRNRDQKVHNHIRQQIRTYNAELNNKPKSLLECAREAAKHDPEIAASNMSNSRLLYSSSEGKDSFFDDEEIGAFSTELSSTGRSNTAEPSASDQFRRSSTSADNNNGGMKRWSSMSWQTYTDESLRGDNRSRKLGGSLRLAPTEMHPTSFEHGSGAISQEQHAPNLHDSAEDAPSTSKRISMDENGERNVPTGERSEHSHSQAGQQSRASQEEVGEAEETTLHVRNSETRLTAEGDVEDKEVNDVGEYRYDSSTDFIDFSASDDDGYESMYMPSEIESQWEQLGFTSLEQARAALKLVMLCTSSETRRKLLKCEIDDGSEEAETEQGK